MRLTKIVSGGQTGADRGGLDAAMYCKLPYGGWVPKGRRDEEGVIPSRYDALRETRTSSYLERTEANVVDSDATLVMVCGLLKSASLRTCTFAEKHGKPHLVVNLASDRKAATNRIVDWLLALPQQEGVLNVAGSRESKVPGIEDVTRSVMITVISHVNGS
jgi:Circularly permutated YpsA SLOG family